MSSLLRVRITADLPPKSPLPSSKKRKRQDNPDSNPSKPPSPNLTPNNCVLCWNNIGDACRPCEALLLANEQLPDDEIRDIICHAVECRECGRRFHYHCIARKVSRKRDIQQGRMRKGVRVNLGTGNVERHRRYWEKIRPNPVPPRPGHPVPPRCWHCVKSIEDVCPRCQNLLRDNDQCTITCDAVKCRGCGRWFHYHCIVGSEFCPFGGHPWNIQQQLGGVGIDSQSPAKQISVEKKRNLQDSSDSIPPLAPAPAHPARHNCFLCQKNIRDAITGDIIFDAVKCRGCNRWFHNHCVTQWRVNKMSDICPVQVAGVHPFVSDYPQQGGVSIEVISSSSLTSQLPPTSQLPTTSQLPPKKRMPVISPPLPQSPPPKDPSPPTCPICTICHLHACPNCTASTESLSPAKRHMLCPSVVCSGCLDEFHYHCIKKYIGKDCFSGSVHTCNMKQLCLGNDIFLDI